MMFTNTLYLADGNARLLEHIQTLQHHNLSNLRTIKQN